MLDNIGKLVHQQRRSLNLTIEKLAERSGVSISLISRMERGDVNNISIKKLTDIARALNMQVGDFFIAPEMSDISTLAVVKYLTHLPEKRTGACFRGTHAGDGSSERVVGELAAVANKCKNGSRDTLSLEPF